MNRILIGVCAAAVLGVGTLALASQSLPGGLFYGIKLGLLERVEASFSGSGPEWNIKIAERRLVEARKAALKGRFNSEAAQTAVLTSFNNQMKELETHINALKAENKLAEVKQVASSLGRMLATQAEALTAAQAEANASSNTKVTGSLDFIMLRVTSSLTAAAQIALSTLIEDAAPDTSGVPKTDEWGRPI